jgi:hypothetical protein
MPKTAQAWRICLQSSDAERALFTNQELLARNQTAIVVDGRSTATAELRTPKP